MSVTTIFNAGNSNEFGVFELLKFFQAQKNAAFSAVIMM